MKTGNNLLLTLLFSCLLQAEPLLPKSVLIEQYLISAQRYENSMKYDKATKEFKKIEALQETLPANFYYLYAKNLYLTQDYTKAKEYFAVYFRKVSRKDKHYKEALNYLGKIDEKTSDEKIRYDICDGLGEEIAEELDQVEYDCNKAVYDKIGRNIFRYPNTTTTQMHDKWYPECLYDYKKKKYNKLKKIYRRNSCKEYE